MKTINWGVIGTAGIAKGCTIPGMQLAENCNLYAIAGRTLEKAEAFQKEFGFEKAYGSYEELLADPAVEAVYIPLPNDLHCEWTLKAMEAGKHVLCEKPWVPDVETAEKLIRASKENNVIMMEAFAYLHSPYIAAVKKELDNGVIGKVKYMETSFLTSDYDLSNIRMQKERYGGGLYDLGCYCTSMILTMMGEEPEKIQAMAEFSEELKIDVFVSALMKFKDDVRASFTCGMMLDTDQDHRYDHLYIQGSKGYIRSDVEYNQCGDLSYTVCIDGVKTVKTVPVRQNYSLEVEQLGRCITDGEQPHVSHDFTIANLRTIERILKIIGY